MIKDHQRNLIDTIKARLERAKEGDYMAMFNIQDSEIVNEPGAGLSTYFKPARQKDIDEYGRIRSQGENIKGDTGSEGK